MVNPKAAAIAFGTILAIDAFFHVFFPAIGIDFLVWNANVFTAFIAWAPGVSPTILGAFVASFYGFVWGALLGHVFSLIYNTVDRVGKRKMA